MALCLLSCGIFKAELEKILEVDNLGQKEKPQIKYTLPALHVDYDGLKKGITDGLEGFKGEKTAILYGSMCHPDLSEIVQPYRTNYPEQGNCIDLFIKPEHKKEIEKGENIFYLTIGWLQNWKKIFQQGQGWD